MVYHNQDQLVLRKRPILFADFLLPFEVNFGKMNTIGSTLLVDKYSLPIVSETA